MNKFDDIIIIIPSLNPDERLLSLVKNLKESNFNQIILINDGSNEGNLDIFERAKSELECTVLHHHVNFGKGRALKTGFNHVLNENPDFCGVITVDADGQHCVEDIVKCANKLKDTKDTFIIGCRDFSQKGIPFRSRIGNKVTCKVTKYLCGINVSDTQTGLRGIPKNLLVEIVSLVGERFEYEMNMLLYVTKNEIPIVEVFIQTIYLEKNETSHFRVFTDSFLIYKILLNYLLSSGIAVLVDFTVFSILINLHISILVATYASRLVSSIFNFIINKNIVFKYKENFLKSMIQYYGLVIFMGFVSAMTVSFLKKSFGCEVIIAKMVVEGILFFVNYYIQETFIFKKKRKGLKRS